MASNNGNGNIPDIVISRLPIYLRALNRLAADGQEITSSHELGQRLGISSAQIRKDLSHFGGFGKQGTGYHISFLQDRLRKVLHVDREWEVALVGIGGDQVSVSVPAGTSLGVGDTVAIAFPRDAVHLFQNARAVTHATPSAGV